MTDKDAEPKRTGRPPRHEGERLSKNRTFRVRPELDSDLAKAADESGRSVSEEIEYRLGRSFAEDKAFPDSEMKLWAYVAAKLFASRGSHEAKRLGHPEWTTAQWMKNSECYNAALVGVVGHLLREHPGVSLDELALAFDHLNSRLFSAENRVRGEGGGFVDER